MKDKIEKKIAEIIDYIIKKPAKEISLDDYTILQNELNGIRNQEAQIGNSKRMAELMAFVTNPNLTNGISKGN